MSKLVQAPLRSPRSRATSIINRKSKNANGITLPTAGILSAASERIERLSVADLRRNPRNARTHPDGQVARLASAISRFGFVNPIIVDEMNMVLAGHGRLAAAERLGLANVPALRVNRMSEAEKRAYVIADNRIAELAGWNREALKQEFIHLTDPAIAFDVEVTGFDTGMIDMMLLEGGEPSKDRPEDLVIEPNSGPPVSRVGDLWLLGSHRLICGDAREASVIERLLGGEQAQMVFTDPPYNVPIAGHAQGLGRIRHRDFVMASGEMSGPAFRRFLERVLGHCAAVSVAGSIHFVCMDWRHMGDLLAVGEDVYGELKNLCIWAKTNAGMGAFYRSQHELVFVFKNGNAPHINNFGLGEKGRHRTNVWTYPGVNIVGGQGQDDLALHPTVKPLALVADAIRDCSHRNGLILDPFGGSGTTLIAAEHTGRRAALTELDPAYVDVAIRRFEALRGPKAVLEATGETFEEVRRQRLEAGELKSVAPLAETSVVTAPRLRGRKAGRK
jgi:DNA modification methylase